MIELFLCFTLSCKICIVLYFKTPLMRQYDTEYGDIPSHYHDKVKELLRGLEEELLAYELQLTTSKSSFTLNSSFFTK